MMNLESISWQPAKMGGAIFETNVFEIKNEHSLVISPSKFFKIFVPIIVILMNILPLLPSIVFQKTPSIIIILLVMIFDIIMLFVYIQGLYVVEIDKKTDTIKKGLSLKTAKVLKKVSEIKFIQIVEELIPNKKNYNVSYSYEINLVYNDDTRFNLTDHSILIGIHENARVLKQFIGCPIYTKKYKTQEIIEIV